MLTPIAAFSPEVRFGDSTPGGGIEEVVVKKTDLVEVGPDTAEDGDNDVDNKLSLNSISVGRAPGGNSERSLGFHAILIAPKRAVPGPQYIGVLPRMLCIPLFGGFDTNYAVVLVVYTEVQPMPMPSKV